MQKRENKLIEFSGDRNREEMKIKKRSSRPEVSVKRCS